MPVRHVNNGDGSVTQFDADTGQELVTFLDPDGSFTANHLEPVAAAPAQEAPRGANRQKLLEAAQGMAGATQTVTPETTTVSPAPQLTPSEARFQQHLQGKGVLETAGVSVPEPTSGLSEQVADAPLPSPTPRNPLPVAGITREGLSPESQAVAEQSRANIMAATEEADTATGEAEQQQLAATDQRVRAEAERRLGQAAADAQLSDLAQRKLAEAQEFGRQARATPISPSKALGGDKFFFAILANVGAAMSNFGSALLGQGPTMDPNVVDDIIRDSVNQQLADRQMAVEGADMATADARAEQIRGEIRANASLEKWFEAQAQVEKLPELKASYAANAQQRAAARAEKERALAETEFTRESVQMAAPKPGEAQPILNAETAEEKAVLDANGVSKESMAKYTNERVKTGADAFLASADRADEVITKLTNGQDVPGSGPLDKLLQPLARGEDGAAVQQATGFLTAQFGKLISGASMTDAERQMLTGLIEGRGTLDDWKRGISMLRGHANSQLDSLNSGYSAEARAYDTIGQMRKGRRQLSDEQVARRDAQLKGSQREDRVLGTDESGKPYYESPEAKRKREAAEGRAKSESERKRNSANNDRARIAKELGF